MRRGRDEEQFIETPAPLRACPAGVARGAAPHPPRRAASVPRGQGGCPRPAEAARPRRADQAAPAGGHGLVSRGCPRAGEVRRRLSPSQAASRTARASSSRPTAAYGRYLKRALAPYVPQGQHFGRAEVDQAIRFLFLALKRYGIVEQVRSGATATTRATRSTPTRCAGCRPMVRFARSTARACWRPARSRPRSTATSSSATAASSI